MSSFFDRFVQRADNILASKGQLAVLVRPAVQVLSQRATRDGHVIPVNQFIFQELCQDL